MIKAECTWGDGPDVLIVGKDEKILNLSDTIDKDRFTHGCQKDWHLDLTKDKAKELVCQLNNAIRQVEDIESSLKSYIENHYHE